jgi:uncharacterized protein (DUF433 family)
MGEPVFAATEAAVIIGAPLRAVRKAVENRLLRKAPAKRARMAFTKRELVALGADHRLVRLGLPLAARRQIVRALCDRPTADTITAGDDALRFHVKPVRRQVEAGVRLVAELRRLATSDPERLGGEPVFRGTAIPVALIATMVEQGVSPSEIRAGYPALSQRQISLAPAYMRAFPVRGRPRKLPWRRRKPRKVSRVRLPAGADA